MTCLVLSLFKPVIIILNFKSIHTYAKKYVPVVDKNSGHLFCFGCHTHAGHETSVWSWGPEPAKQPPPLREACELPLSQCCPCGAGWHLGGPLPGHSCERMPTGCTSTDVVPPGAIFPPQEVPYSDSPLMGFVFALKSSILLGLPSYSKFLHGSIFYLKSK